MPDSIAAIQARIAATFDHTQTNPVQLILDEEGPEALIDAVLTARNQEATVGTHGTREQTVMHSAVEWALRNAGLSAGPLDEARDEFLDELGERGFLVRAAGRDSLTDITTAARRLLDDIDRTAPLRFCAGCGGWAEHHRRDCSAVALRRLVDGRPTDEPTKADPPLSELLANQTERADDHLRALTETKRAWTEAKDELHRVRAVRDELADEIERLRALAGGRPAAPDRDQIAEVADIIRSHVWPAEPPVPGLVEAGLEPAAEVILALLSRSAAEPPAFDPETFKRFAATADPQALAELIEQATGARVESVQVGVAAEPDERCTYCDHDRDAHRSTVGEGDPLTHCRACGCGGYINADGQAAEPDEEHGDGTTS